MKSNMSLYKNMLFIENVGKMKLVFISLLVLFWCLLDHGVFGESVSAMEGDPVTLHTGVTTNQQEKIRWHFYDTRIAQISGDLSKICTDVQCNEGTERFRDRLKLDHQTGSLIIMNTRTTDSGLYHLKVLSSSRSEMIFNVTIYSFFAVGEDGVLVFLMEGDSVTFQTRVKANQQDRIRWYFNSTRIAEITGDQCKICTDVQCNEGTERFRDRLKVDHQTGTLTIMNTRTTDAGLYHLKITSINNERDKTFIFAIRGVSAAERNETKSVKEGESVTLHPGKIKNPNDCKMWYFKDIFIFHITGDQSKICTDAQCKERFRDRLKLDHQTGSLNITNTRNTDSGDYKLLIISSRFSIFRSFSVTITGVPAPGLSSTAAGGICTTVVLVLLVAAVFGIYHWHRSRKTETRAELSHQLEALSHNGNTPNDVANGASTVHSKP
uniref:Immunoglobulin domain-containing protein n=1 Tax=Cyprinus carpio TaxID=7962 RepID=A0A8C2D4M4_CYPCA